MLVFLAALARAYEGRLVVKEGEDPGCVICKQIVVVVEELMVSNTTQQEIIDVCNFLCQQLPATYAPLCSNIIAQYVPLVCQWIEQGIEAVDICGKLGFCPTQKVTKRSKVTVVRRVRGPACDMCTKMVGYIEDLLKNTTVVEEIVQACDDLCEYQQLISDLCKQLVGTYVPTIIAWLEQGLESLDICTKVGFCSIAPDSARMAKIKAKSIMKGRSDNDVFCEMCKSVVTYIEELITSAVVEEEIERLVDEMCEKLPAPISTACTTVCAEFVPLIIQWLEQEMEVLDICVKIGLCTSESKVKAAAPAEKKGSDYQCIMCETAVSLIQNLLKSTTVESEIEAKVKQYCQTLSSPWQSACETMVAQFVPVIVEWIEQGIEALQICISLGLCEKTEPRPKILKFEIH